jgi:hypothetical protein
MDVFTCPHCGMVSHHPEDVRYNYCGRCHLFVDDRWWMARRELPDGRLLFLVRQVHNWKLTIGWGEQIWDDGY